MDDNDTKVDGDAPIAELDVLAELERVRNDLLPDIALLERMGEEVIEVRKRLRKALQTVDRLEKTITHEVTGLRTQVAEKDHRIEVLEAELAVALASLAARGTP